MARQVEQRIRTVIPPANEHPYTTVLPGEYIFVTVQRRSRRSNDILSMAAVLPDNWDPPTSLQDFALVVNEYKAVLVPSFAGRVVENVLPSEAIVISSNSDSNDPSPYAQAARQMSRWLELRPYEPTIYVTPRLTDYRLRIKLTPAAVQEDGLQCPICLDLPKRLMVTPCEHVYCNACIYKWVLTQHYLCPLCRRKIL